MQVFPRTEIRFCIPLVKKNGDIVEPDRSEESGIYKMRRYYFQFFGEEELSIVLDNRHIPVTEIITEIRELDILDIDSLLEFVQKYNVPGNTEPIYKDKGLIGQSIEGIQTDITYMKNFIDIFFKPSKKKS